MATYIVTYDLHSPGQNYSALLSAIQSLGVWAKLSESCYSIVSNNTPQNIFNFLNQYLDANDQLYVIQLSRNYSGKGKTDVNNWLNSNLF